MDNKLCEIYRLNVDFNPVLEANMSRTITYDSQGRDITCMKEFDALKYSREECDRKEKL